MEVSPQNTDLAAQMTCSNVTANSSVSRFATEEEITDSVFLACDVLGHGCVPVSQLVNCIRNAGGDYSSEYTNEKFLILLDILDPDHVDPCINLETYRSGVGHWIQSCRSEIFVDQDNFEDQSVATKDDESVLEERSVSILQQSTPILPPVLASIVSPTSLDFSSIIEDCNVIELQNHLEHLEMQNKKLTEEVSELRQQLNASDDTVSTLRHEICELRKTLKSHQVTIEKLSEIRRENVQLRNEIANCKEENLGLRSNLTRQEQNIKDLTDRMKDLQQQLSTGSSDYEIAQDEIFSLHERLTGLTLELVNVKEAVEYYEQQLADKQNVVEALLQKLDEKGEANKNLIRHNSEIEMQLNETQQILRSQMLEFSKRGLSDCLKENVGDEEDVELMPLPMASSFVVNSHSTPNATNRCSLHQEISSVVVTEPVFPSPICDKSLESIFADAFGIFPSSEHDDTIDFTVEDFNKKLSSFQMTPTDDRKCISSRSYRTQKQEAILKEIEKLIELSVSNDKEFYEQELRRFADQMLLCAEARISAEHRNFMLFNSINQMKELLEEKTASHQNDLDELTNRFGVEMEALRLLLKERDDLVEVEKHKNEELTAKILRLEDEAVGSRNSYASTCSIVSEIDFVVVENVSDSSFYENIPSVKDFNRTFAMLLELFMAFRRQRHSHRQTVQPLMIECAFPVSTNIGTSHGDGAVPGKRSVMTNTGSPDDKCAVASNFNRRGYHFVIFLLTTMLIILLSLILLRSRAGSCHLLGSSAVKEILQPYIHFRHIMEPPV